MGLVGLWQRCPTGSGRRRCRGILCGAGPNHTLVGTTADDEVAATHSVGEGCLINVTREFVLARFGIVDAVGAVNCEAVAPAVLGFEDDGGTVGGGVGSGGRGGVGLVGIAGGFAAL